MSDERSRRPGARRTILAASLALAGLTGSLAPASAQGICAQLEAEFARAGAAAPPSAADQAHDRQRSEHARLVAASRQRGCDALFGRRPPACAEIRSEIARAEADLRRLEQQRRQNAASDRRRDAIQAALERNGCRRAPQAGGNIFTLLFGQPQAGAPPPDPGRPLEGDGADAAETGEPSVGGTYRTLCVRACDGYFWPISFSTLPRFFSRDAKVCAASCPNQQVRLYTHKTSGEWSEKAVSLDGTPYAKTPTAFVYRSVYRPECVCSRPEIPVAARDRKDRGRRQDETVRVSPALAGDAAGRPIEIEAKAAEGDPVETTAAIEPQQGEEAAPPPQAPASRKVRIVGPAFLPGQ